MNNLEVHEEIFANGSTTFHKSTNFFPPKLKAEVTILYAFVRKVDDFVDNKPQNKKGFIEFKNKYHTDLKKGRSDDPIIEKFIQLQKKRHFEQTWISAFFESMEADTKKIDYKSYTDTLKYIYGSAEVIGLFMARLMNLADDSACYAALLGRAYQLINFIRDINEDLHLGRSYFPQQELELFGLKTLTYAEVTQKPERFKAFIRSQINRFFMYLEQAHLGFEYMPFDYILPIKTASDMFSWTAKKIHRDPFIIYRRKVKPNKLLIYFQGLVNYLSLKR